MVQGHGGREAYVAAARRRLNELNKELKIQLPGLRDGDQVRSGRRLHRVFRRPREGRPRAGLGRHVPLRADHERQGVGGLRRGIRRAHAPVERARLHAARGGSRRPPQGQDLRVPAADGGAARSAQRVHHRRLRLDPIRSADPAARRVLHERHAGRHAHRSAARRHRTPVRRGGRGGLGRWPRQGVLHRAAAQGRDARGVRARRRQPPSRGPEGRDATGRVRRDDSGGRARARALHRELQPESQLYRRRGSRCRDLEARSSHPCGCVARCDDRASASRSPRRCFRLGESLSG